MANAAQVNSVFNTYTKTLEEDCRRLKCISNIKQVVAAGGQGGKDVSIRLKDIESVAKDVSSSLDRFEDALDEDLEALDEIKEIIAMSTRSREALADLKTKTPAKMLPKEVGLNSMPSLAEFEAIPKATRLRISFDMVVKSLVDIQKLIDRKSKLVHSRTPRSKVPRPRRIDLDEYEARKTAEHEDSVFILEAEMKGGATCVFDHGASTGRAILATLRAMQRLRVVRSGREATYVLCRPKQ